MHGLRSSLLNNQSHLASYTPAAAASLYRVPTTPCSNLSVVLIKPCSNLARGLPWSPITKVNYRTHHPPSGCPLDQPPPTFFILVRILVQDSKVDFGQVFASNTLMSLSIPKHKMFLSQTS